MRCKTPWCRRAAEIVGWKVGAANPQALPARAALTRKIRCGSAPPGRQELPAAGFAVMGVEAELAYELGCDLPAP
jgi:2-keto-4-pentenoate hydratase